MRRILMVTVATIILLWSTTTITAFASALQTRTFRTNLAKGEYVDDGMLEPEESVDDEPIDVAEEIITDLVEIADPQESDEHSEISTPTDIESVAIEDTGDLDQLEEPAQSQLDAPENIGDSTEPVDETPIDSEENEEEHETEVQSTQ